MCVHTFLLDYSPDVSIEIIVRQTTTPPPYKNESWTPEQCLVGADSWQRKKNDWVSYFVLWSLSLHQSKSCSHWQLCVTPGHGSTQPQHMVNITLPLTAVMNPDPVSLTPIVNIFNIIKMLQCKRFMKPVQLVLVTADRARLRQKHQQKQMKMNIGTGAMWTVLMTLMRVVY